MLDVKGNGVQVLSRTGCHAVVVVYAHYGTIIVSDLVILQFAVASASLDGYDSEFNALLDFLFGFWGNMRNNNILFPFLRTLI